MKAAYPAVIRPSTSMEGWYVASIPDLGLDTQGNGIDDALFMAYDAIGLWSTVEIDCGRQVPKPSTTEPPHKPDEFVHWIEIDFDEYRHAHEKEIVYADTAMTAT
ncbi:MAG: type II toxin-antitoxin system HicB family antitoxin [Coriobacteriia bacterium]|nr:type II toxin-antitoxin system HicB family antitoxin [Coriobacteriia bacterium]